jgi:hypothetical protein
MLLPNPPKRYLLELRNAAANTDGSFTWTFTERHLVRPKQVRIGPVSVTTDIFCRNVVVTSDSFQNSSAPWVHRPDAMKQVLCVVHPETQSNPPVETDSSGATQTSAAGSDQSLVDMGDALIAWLDMGATNKVYDNTYTSSAVGGPLVYHILNRSTAHSDLQLSAAYGSGLSLSNLGNTVAVTRTASWESFLDTMPFPYTLLSETYHVHSLIRLTDQGWTYIWDLDTNKTLMWGNPATLSYYDASDQQVSVGVTMLPLRTYLLSVARVSDGAGGYVFDYRVEDLDNESEPVQSVTTATGGKDLTANPGAWRFGHASTHFDHLQGSFIFITGTDTTQAENARAWLRNQYGSTATEGTNTEQTNANQWYQLYDTRTTQIEMNQPAEVQRQITVRFEDHNGTLLVPKDAVLHVEIERN